MSDLPAPETSISDAQSANHALWIVVQMLKDEKIQQDIRFGTGTVSPAGTTTSMSEVLDRYIAASDTLRELLENEGLGKVVLDAEDAAQAHRELRELVNPPRDSPSAPERRRGERGTSTALLGELIETGRASFGDDLSKQDWPLFVADLEFTHPDVFADLLQHAPNGMPTVVQAGYEHAERAEQALQSFESALTRLASPLPGTVFVSPVPLETVRSVLREHPDDVAGLLSMPEKAQLAQALATVAERDEIVRGLVGDRYGIAPANNNAEMTAIEVRRPETAFEL